MAATSTTTIVEPLHRWRTTSPPRLADKGAKDHREGPVLGPALLLSASLRDVDDGLRDLLLTLSPTARDKLRVLIRDQADRGAIVSRFMSYRDQNGQEWADIIDFLTMYPEARRVLGPAKTGRRLRPSARRCRGGALSLPGSCRSRPSRSCRTRSRNSLRP
jgi:hypothetical protein